MTSMDPTASPAQQQYPNLNPYQATNGSTTSAPSSTAAPTNGSIENAKNTAVNSESPTSSSFPTPSNPSAAANQAMDSVKNSETYQTLASGPMAQKTRAEADNTRNEFANLASAKQTPSHTAATGQNLTHYHSFFYNLLSWENPRATAISYVAIISFIFATRYVPLVRYGLKLSWMILGIMAAAEGAGKLVFGEGFATKMRPKRYYTVPRETLESVMEDLVELANFFVIEFQRIVFAENVYITIGAFATSLITYYLVKITPTWGMALLLTTLGFFVPLAYLQNQELIDSQLNNASAMINEQTTQIRDLATQQTNKAVEASSGALKTYGARASEMVGQAKKAAVEKGIVKEETVGGVPATKAEDFPAAPSVEPVAVQPTVVQQQHDGTADLSAEKEPLLA